MTFRSFLLSYVSPCGWWDTAGHLNIISRARLRVSTISIPPIHRRFALVKKPGTCTTPDSPPNIVGVAFVVLTGRVQCRFGGHIWSDRAEDRPWAMSMWVYSAYAGTPIVAVVRPKKAWPGLATRLSRLQPLLYAGPLIPPGTARQLSRISSAVP